MFLCDPTGVNADGPILYFNDSRKTNMINIINCHIPPNNDHQV